MDSGTNLFFEVDSNQIKIKKLLGQEFLELQMNAISNVNPNLNKSWFTLESMEKALPTFKNKPILGFFENGDFVSHNGQWRKDLETNMPYWDTLGLRGERILGVIREQDEVKITQDENGLSWITLNCVLWTSYAFKQVQRLLKDAMRAEKTGKPTKHISVEVTITKSEKLANGILRIDEFVLKGITILGSQNGREVTPGIPDAELSIVDFEGTEAFNQQQEVLRLAYAKLDEGSEQVNKEGDSQVENDNIQNVGVTEGNNAVNPEENVNNAANSEDNAANFEGNNEDNTSANENNSNSEENKSGEGEDNTQHYEGSDVCPKCGNNPCTCSADENKDGEGDDDDDDDNDDDKDGEGDENQSAGCGDENQQQNQSCECGCDEDEHRDPIHDLAWMVNDCSWNQERYSEAIKYYEREDVNVPHKEAIIALLKRLLNQELEAQKDLAELLAKVAAEGSGISDEDADYECKLSEHNCKELYSANLDLISKNTELEAKYAELEKTHNEAMEKLAKFEKDAFMSEARSVIALFNDVEESFAAEVLAKCDKGEITTVEGVKTEVALHIGMSALNNGSKTQKEAPKSFSAPAPETPVVSTATKKGSTPRTATDVLHDYISKK